MLNSVIIGRGRIGEGEKSKSPRRLGKRTGRLLAWYTRLVETIRLPRTRPRTPLGWILAKAGTSKSSWRYRLGERRGIEPGTRMVKEVKVYDLWECELPWEKRVSEGRQVRGTKEYRAWKFAQWYILSRRMEVSAELTGEIARVGIPAWQILCQIELPRTDSTPNAPFTLTNRVIPYPRPWYRKWRIKPWVPDVPREGHSYEKSWNRRIFQPETMRLIRRLRLTKAFSRPSQKESSTRWTPRQRSMKYSNKRNDYDPSKYSYKLRGNEKD